MQGARVLSPEDEIVALRSELSQLIMRRADEGGERLPSRGGAEWQDRAMSRPWAKRR